MNTTELVKEKMTQRTLRILKANSGMKTMELFKSVYNRSPQYSTDKIGYELSNKWHSEIFVPLIESGKIGPAGGFGNGYMVRDQ